MSMAVGMVSCSPAPVARVEDPATPVPATPAPTPHPAVAARAQAVTLYPDLAKDGSLFNQTFRNIYAQELASNPMALQGADWPLGLAKKTAVMLNVETVPRSAPVPAAPAIQSAPAAMPPTQAIAQAPGSPFPASHFLPKATSSISFDVRSVATGGGQSTGTPQPTGRSAYSTGVSRVRERQTVLELRARNLSNQPATVNFEWIFLAKNVSGRGSAYVWDRGQKQISLEGGADTKETLESSEIVQVSTVNSQRRLVSYSDGSSGYEMISSQSKSGSRPVGWAVRMMADGKVVRVQASSSEYERFAFDSRQPGR